MPRHITIVRFDDRVSQEAAPRVSTARQRLAAAEKGKSVY
jgi:hypothetical protein